MTRATDPRTEPETYRLLLERLESWFATGRGLNPGVVPCRSGCAACCHGPFDISVADAELLVEGIRRLPEGERDEVERRARALLDRMHALEPGWTAPHDLADLGEERFDRLADALAAEPCPLLGDDGACRVYEHRPLVCRIIGLPMLTPAGRLIENECPIVADFAGYAQVRPVLFDLEGFEVEEWDALLGAARRLLGSPVRHDYETTIATAIVDHAGERRGPAPGAAAR